jgi:hypothetical protein
MSSEHAKTYSVVYLNIFGSSDNTQPNGTTRLLVRERALEIMLKVVAPFEIKSRNLLGETEENRVKATGCRSKICTKDLPSTKQEFYPLSSDDR